MGSPIETIETAKNIKDGKYFAALSKLAGGGGAALALRAGSGLPEALRFGAGISFPLFAAHMLQDSDQRDRAKYDNLNVSRLNERELKEELNQIDIQIARQAQKDGFTQEEVEKRQGMKIGSKNRFDKSRTNYLLGLLDQIEAHLSGINDQRIRENYSHQAGARRWDTTYGIEDKEAEYRNWANDEFAGINIQPADSPTSKRDMKYYDSYEGIPNLPPQNPAKKSTIEQTPVGAAEINAYAPISYSQGADEAAATSQNSPLGGQGDYSGGNGWSSGWGADGAAANPAVSTLSNLYPAYGNAGGYGFGGGSQPGASLLYQQPDQIEPARQPETQISRWANMMYGHGKTNQTGGLFGGASAEPDAPWAGGGAWSTGWAQDENSNEADSQPASLFDWRPNSFVTGAEAVKARAEAGMDSMDDMGQAYQPDENSQTYSGWDQPDLDQTEPDDLPESQISRWARMMYGDSDRP